MIRFGDRDSDYDRNSDLDRYSDLDRNSDWEFGIWTYIRIRIWNGNESGTEVNLDWDPNYKVGIRME